MILAEEDIFLLSEIYSSGLKKEVVTTWTLAKKYNWPDKSVLKTKKDELDYYDNKMMLVSARLKKMARMGFIDITKDKFGKNVYTVLVPMVVKKKYKMPDNKIKETIAIKDNNKWTIFEV